MSTKALRVTFWITTVLFAVPLAWSAVQYLIEAPKMVATMTDHLGYPLYFTKILGVAKIAGVVALLAPFTRRIKEWADIDKPESVVAVAKGTLHEPVMRDKLKAAQLLVLDTPFAREQEVQSGRADVFMTDYPYGQRFLANAEWARLVSPPGVYHVTPYAYAVRPGDDAWLARLNNFVAAIKQDGRLLDAAKRHRLDPIVAP